MRPVHGGLNPVSQALDQALFTPHLYTWAQIRAIDKKQEAPHDGADVRLA
jgi:hypothetical protein